ncbi:MAG: PKD domain-containing protein [Flavobacteriales bacterium]|nr:PKD domain-containing protein [Flavobacteriales bacterium]
MKATLLQIVFTLSVALFSIGGLAQGNIFISNGEVTACGGSFQDDNSGGAEGSPYSDTDYTFTICPDTPGDVIQVDFVAFSLQTSPNPNNSDYLTIYDGDNTGESSLGSYAGNFLQGLAVTGTVNNTSGCLTFVFTCNTGNTNSFPGWEALISCTTPCAPPTALSEVTNPLPSAEGFVGVCMGDEITFSDAGSFAETGFTLGNYIWDLGDGTILEGANLTEVIHAYDEPGEFIVTLTVQDNNGCYSLNVVPMQVLVSTIPVFYTDWTEVVCLGGEGFVDGNPIQNVTWTALPPQVVAGETYLADGAGFSYSSELTFDFFETDAVLENCDDFLSVFVNMEHSYLGDLEIYIECPDGTSVTLLDWGLNSGGGTFLGEAVDDGTTLPGTGYDYGWMPGLTNGNLDDGNSSSVTYTNNAGQNVTANIVDPGFYESDEDLCNLVGCPLNGTWTMNVIDNLAIDNGYIFEWGLSFNPYLYPDITTFTPEVGLGVDSSWWEGPYITSTSADGNVAYLEPPALGTYEYTYFATNNFGCTYDTTVVVEVVPGPVVDAGQDQTLCGDLQLNAVIVSNEFPTPPCQFTIELYNDANMFGWDGASIDVTIDGQYQGNYTTFNNSTEVLITIESGQLLEIDYFASPWGGTAGNAFNIFDDSGNLVFASDDDPADGLVFSSDVLCVGEGQIQYEWTPSTDVDNPNIPNPTITQLSGGETQFEVTAYPAGFPGCASSDFVTITPAFEYSTTSGNPSCAGNDGFIHVYVNELTGNPPWTIEFYENGGLVETVNSNGGTEEFNGLFPGNYTVSIINAACTYDIDFVIDQPDIIVIETSPDSTICIGGTAVLEASSPQDVDDSWTYIWDQGVGNGMSVAVQPDVPTTYSVFAIDDFGCESAAVTVDVDIFDGLSLEVANDTLICIGGTADLLVQSSSGGNGGPYEYFWTYNSQFVSSDEDFQDEPSADGEYCVTLTDGCETPAVTECMMVTLEEELIVKIESDTTRGCYPADIVFSVGNDPDSYALAQWTISDGTFIFNSSEFTHTFEEPGSYSVGLTLTSPIGCVYSAYEENYISIFDNPKANFHFSPIPTTIPETEINFFDDSEGSISDWLWVFDTINYLGVSHEQNPVFSFPYDVPGDYPVTLTVTDENGCENSVMKWVVIYDIFNVFVPNSFTPNADGVNDVFFVQGSDIDPDRFELIIFDRWGEKVFETRDMNVPWLGQVNNGKHYANEGIYEWRLVVYSLSTTERYILQGTVNVIR